MMAKEIKEVGTVKNQEDLFKDGWNLLITAISHVNIWFTIPSQLVHKLWVMQFFLGRHIVSCQKGISDSPSQFLEVVIRETWVPVG